MKRGGVAPRGLRGARREADVGLTVRGLAIWGVVEVVPAVVVPCAGQQVGGVDECAGLGVEGGADLLHTVLTAGRIDDGAAGVCDVGAVGAAKGAVVASCQVSPWGVPVSVLGSVWAAPVQAARDHRMRCRRTGPPSLGSTTKGMIPTRAGCARGRSSPGRVGARHRRRPLGDPRRRSARDHIRGVEGRNGRPRYGCRDGLRFGQGRVRGTILRAGHHARRDPREMNLALTAHMSRVPKGDRRVQM